MIRNLIALLLYWRRERRRKREWAKYFRAGGMIR